MSDNGRDDFWNIERLVPPRAHRHKTVRYDVSGAEITVPADDDSVRGSDADREGRRLTSLSAEREREELVCEYSPDNSFVRRVQVYARQGGFHYYEDFERTMHKYLRLTVKHAEREPFFSYVPQYSQLSGARMSWYLYWRSACRRREYLPTDYSYVLLYVYELLNFHNLRHPDIMADELCSLWAAYRAEYPQLDRCMPDWVCDYCLIHRTAFPYSTVADFMDELIPHVSMREFFLGAREHGDDSYARAVILGASGYNYRKSKYYTHEIRALFDTHIVAAAANAIAGDSAGFRDICEQDACSVVRRDAYAGALCTSSARRVLCIEYTPLYRSGELRLEATLAVKYAENKLRAVLGVRSRLSVTGLSASLRASIDAYFSEHFAGVFDRSGRTHEERESSREYLALYESETHGLTPALASEIEAESWATAELMGEGFDEAAEESVPEEVTLGYPFATDGAYDLGGADGGGYEALGEMLDPSALGVLTLIARGESSEVKRTAAADGVFLSDLCERINEASLDATGDILIELVDGEYRILADYDREVKEWLKI